MTMWCVLGDFEDHLTIYPCYIGNVEKGGNDTHGCTGSEQPGRTSSRFFCFMKG